jgi:hypothetical protein
VTATITTIESLLRRSIREQLGRRQAEATALFAAADELQNDADALHGAAGVKYREAARAQAEVENLARRLEEVR